MRGQIPLLVGLAILGMCTAQGEAPPIPHCVKETAGACTQCMGGFYVFGLTECRQCSQGCLACETDGVTCTSCQGAYFKDGTTCKACMPSCESCSSAKICDTCVTGFKMADKICERETSRAYFLSGIFAIIISLAAAYLWYYINWIHDKKEKVLKPIMGKDALHCGEADSHEAMLEAAAFARLNPFGPDESSSVNAHLAYNVRRVSQLSETTIRSNKPASESQKESTTRPSNPPIQGTEGTDYRKMADPEDENTKEN